MEIDWLPEIICLDSFGGDWGRYVEAIYDVFRRDFVASRPAYHDLTVVIDDRLENGKEAAFWHVTHSYNKVVRERIPELRRCERVCWIRPVIENALSNSGIVQVWSEKKNRQLRTYLWLKEMDYLVVLRVTNSKVAVLITAFVAEREHTRNKLLKTFKRIQKPPGLDT